MGDRQRSLLSSCLKIMLRPIAEFCLSRGFRIQDFIEVSKRVFVESAARALEDQEANTSVSRVSAMTGIQRPEVRRLLSQGERPERKDIVTRLIGQWAEDRRFRDPGGKTPRALGFSGKNSEFERLVRLVSCDLNPHTVRFELERLGLVEVLGKNVVLKKVEFIAEGDPLQVLRYAAEDVSDLTAAVQENAFVSARTPNLHARTQYDNIPDEYVPKIKSSLLALGRKFHAQARALLAPFDRDINPRGARGQGRNRVVVGTFGRVHAVADESEET